ncbi:hypothetical protein ACVBEJ_04840 [Porticoccus sp. GXU_MW_L64]
MDKVNVKLGGGCVKKGKNARNYSARSEKLEGVNLGWFAVTVASRDAGLELTWTYLQRVTANHPRFTSRDKTPQIAPVSLSLQKVLNSHKCPK